MHYLKLLAYIILNFLLAISLTSCLYAPGGDDSLPASPLERLTEGHEGEGVQQTGGRPALYPQVVGSVLNIQEGGPVLDTQVVGPVLDLKE